MKKPVYLLIYLTLTLIFLPYSIAFGVTKISDNCVYNLLKERGLEKYYSESMPDVVRISYEKGVEGAFDDYVSSDKQSLEDINIPELMREHYDGDDDIVDRSVTLAQKRIKVLSVLDAIFRHEKAIIDETLKNHRPSVEDVFVRGVRRSALSWDNTTVGFSHVFVDGIKYLSSLFPENEFSERYLVHYLQEINHIEDSPPYRRIFAELIASL